MFSGSHTKDNNEKQITKNSNIALNSHKLESEYGMSLCRGRMPI